VLIVGGGCNGAGVALECARRGVSALLVEQDDFAAGASSKSSKLLHGGMRYLQEIFAWSGSISSRLEKYRLLT
jgi:glycerol-3-phosphate dehydrogenase